MNIGGDVHERAAAVWFARAHVLLIGARKNGRAKANTGGALVSRQSAVLESTARGHYERC
jgi:hypothetical protein